MNTNDIFQTSYGVGHHWRSGFYFPSHEIRTNMSKSLTRNLDQSSAVPDYDRFLTTNKVFHNIKDSVTFDNKGPMYKKAPSVLNTKYLKDHRFLTNKRPWRRSLSPRNMLSESHDEYRMQQPLSTPKDPNGLKHFLLNKYDTHEFNKSNTAEFIEDKWGGGNLPPIDSEILRNLDPYLTTNLKTHRAWRPEELKGYAKKDITTHWDTKDCPKIKGYGVKVNPLPKDSVPRPELPLRDEIMFPLATTLRRVPNTLVHVPHTGLRSLAMDSYDGSSTALAKAARVCPVDTPYVLPDPGSKAPLSVPMMYKSEYQTYGDCHRTVL